MRAAPHRIDAGILPSPTGPLVVAARPRSAEQPVLSLVVPTLNEGENIGGFLAAVRGVLDRALPGAYELIVVDDDSADGTGDKAAALMPGFPELRVVRRQNESGLAAAVIRGWQVSSGTVLGTINGDFQHPPEVLMRMIERMNDADLVVATRHGDGGGLGDWGWFRRSTSWGARQIGRVVLPEVFDRLSDPLSGYFLIRRDAIQGVRLQPLGYKSLMEVVVRGRVREIRECGYEMRKRSRGKSKVHALHPLQYFRHVLRLRAARGRRE